MTYVRKSTCVTPYKRFCDTCPPVQNFSLYVSHCTKFSLHVSKWRYDELNNIFETSPSCHLSQCTRFMCSPVQICPFHTVKIYFDTCPYWHLSWCTKFLPTHSQRVTSLTVHTFVVTRVKPDTCVNFPFLLWHVSMLTDVALYNYYYDSCRPVHVHYLKTFSTVHPCWSVLAFFGCHLQ